MGLRWIEVGALLGVALAAACSDDGGGGSPAHGDLGYATFRWECAGPGDIACLPEKVEGFPRTVALGARFEASFVLDDSVPIQLEAGRLDLVGPKASLVSSTEGGYDYEGSVGPSATLSALEAGQITLRAMAQDDSVADYVTLSLLPVTSLAVVRDCIVEGCSDGIDGGAVGPVIVGEDIGLRAEPYGDGALLVGSLDYGWESLSPEVATVGSDGGHRATLEPLREGTAFVRVTAGEVEDTVAIMVVSNGPHRRPGSDGMDTDGTDTDGPDTGDTGTASGTGTGSDTDPGTDTDAGTTTGGMQ